MRATTPPPVAEIDPALLQTPRSTSMGRALDRLVRRGDVDAKDAFFKVLKAYEVEKAKSDVLSAELEQIRAQQEVDKAVRAGGKRAKFPQGVEFDQIYREANRERLADWGRQERAKNEKKAADAARQKAEKKSQRKGKHKRAGQNSSRKR